MEAREIEAPAAKAKAMEKSTLLDKSSRDAE